MSYKTNSRTGKPRNGMLTDGQREYLKSDGSGYTDQNKRDYERAIKERVHNTILDFSILFDNWDEFEKWDSLERKRLFNQADGEGDLADGIASMVALIYLENRNGGEMQRLLHRAVRMAESRDYPYAFGGEVEFNVDHSGPEDYDEAIRKFREGDFRDFSDAEAQAVVRMFRVVSEVSPETLQEIEDEVAQRDEELIQEAVSGSEKADES